MQTEAAEKFKKKSQSRSKAGRGEQKWRKQRAKAEETQTQTPTRVMAGKLLDLATGRVPGAVSNSEPRSRGKPSPGNCLRNPDSEAFSEKTAMLAAANSAIPPRIKGPTTRGLIARPHQRDLQLLLLPTCCLLLSNAGGNQMGQNQHLKNNPIPVYHKRMLACFLIIATPVYLNFNF